MLKHLGVIAAAASMALAGTACTPSQEEESTAVERSEAVGAPAPVILRPAELSGQTIDLKLGENLVITESNGLTAEVSNPEVAEFTPARTDGTTEFNAGFAALKKGVTSVKLSDGTAFNLKIS
ncbi:hypothetical protein HMPREF3153_10870 [Corynebacterium sp. HMSC06C06]|uniref:hypothetical protein n=1 Tax=Corynebacterium TaxID=1716 RepID=UPI0008A47A4E|nr:MULTISPECIES: hypothetical protein [Corynebacterium]MDK8812474.1 hypothetical protein [Corynebacterium striatum]OFT49793.1 hypothetical protein HMPREF3153_10870 [Corynebacterium sp. HMSC06C06]HAT1548437.1 hypothetical protein [Corynebacterium striatum]